MDFRGLDGIREGRDDVAQPTFAQRKQSGHDFSVEARSAPAGRDDEQTRKLSGAGGLEVDEGRRNLPCQRHARLGVQCSSPNRRRRSSCEERAGSNKILVHAAILAWTSATWLAVWLPTPT
jgi:hypothetical protein